MRRVATGLLLATLALIVLLGARPTSRETILAAYAIAVAAIALAALTAALQEARADTPSRFAAELTREPVSPTRPADLIRAERELVLAAADDGHFRRRLQPLLREIAAARGVEEDFEVRAPTMRDLAAMIERLEGR
jgi:predicted aspartyl protease